MSRHTNSPWQTSGVRHRMDGQQWLVVTKPDGWLVAYIPYGDRLPDDHARCHADQRLIAAAPDLLAALKELLSNSGYRNMTDDDLRREEELGNEFAPILVRCRSAIAKAEGRP